jgi:hypothetical protein
MAKRYQQSVREQHVLELKAYHRPIAALPTQYAASKKLSVRHNKQAVQRAGGAFWLSRGCGTCRTKLFVDRCGPADHGCQLLIHLYSSSVRRGAPLLITQGNDSNTSFKYHTTFSIRMTRHGNTPRLVAFDSFSPSRALPRSFCTGRLPP